MSDCVKLNSREMAEFAAEGLLRFDGIVPDVINQQFLAEAFELARGYPWNRIKYRVQGDNGTRRASPLASRSGGYREFSWSRINGGSPFSALGVTKFILQSSRYPAANAAYASRFNHRPTSRLRYSAVLFPTRCWA